MPFAPSEVAGISITQMASGARFALLDRYDAYFCGTQYTGLKYNWDGYFDGYGDTADIAPGWFVPYSRRKPSVRLHTPKLITNRFTAMLLGEGRFPEINVPGDPEAEDYVRALAEVSRFHVRLQQARDMGGACGTAVMSYAFLDGKPRIENHRAKHVYVLSWKDRYEHRPSSAIKSYSYKRTVPENGKWVEKTFYYVRYWSETTEVVWDPIPESYAKDGSWITNVKSYSVEHGYGECPVYWIQNRANSEGDDGFSDYDGLCENFDELNRLVSATTKGTVANVDPTLVIKDDATNNTGSLKKGSNNAIFSKGGAKYLELQGTSIKTAMELAREILQYVLDVAGVVLGDPKGISGAAQSAEAMRILYQPMVNECDKLRAQYGDEGGIPFLTGMLRAAKAVGSTGSGGEILTTEDGRRIQEKPVILLPPRIDTTRSKNPETDVEETSTTIHQRTPGNSELIVLKWPAYFKPTRADINQMVDSATKARGVLVSPETATKYVAEPFGVHDIEQELIDIETHKELEMARMPAPDGFPIGDRTPDDFADDDGVEKDEGEDE